MPVSCIVQNCSSRKGKGNHNRISFHTIPSDPTKRERWIKILNESAGIRVDSRSKWEFSSVCGLNFTTESYKTGTNKLKDTAIPTLFTGTVKMDAPAPAEKKARCDVMEPQEAPNSPARSNVEMPITFSDSASNGNITINYYIYT